MGALTLAAVNAMGREEFSGSFGGVCEHSPWVARAAWERRPFGSVAELICAFEATLRDSPVERQVELLRAHPELAGAEAEAGELTAESRREQAVAGLDAAASSSLGRLRELNAAYRERFGFPLVVCAREHTPDSIIACGTRRLGNDPSLERLLALGEVVKIVRLRLEDMIGAPAA